jgi:multiple sugar transport system ATP-binding protein
MFVGGFIGAPAMNFARARLDGASGVLHFPDGNRLPLGPDHAGRRAADGTREVVVGIRPEHFVTDDTSAPRLICQVQVVEPLGADTLLELGLGEAALTARVAPHMRPQPGSLVEIGVDHRHVHLFDPESERTLH